MDIKFYFKRNTDYKLVRLHNLIFLAPKWATYGGINSSGSIGVFSDKAYIEPLANVWSITSTLTKRMYIDVRLARVVDIEKNVTLSVKSAWKRTFDKLEELDEMKLYVYLTSPDFIFVTNMI